MGDIADMLLEGILCIECGCAFGDNYCPGHPRTCEDCIKEQTEAKQRRRHNKKKRKEVL